MQLLRFNTATRVTVGPFFDATDGITPETSITVTSEKLTFIVDEAGVPTLILDVAPTASAGANDMVHITGDDAGYYDLELAAADVNHYGRAKLALTNAAVHCPVFHEFQIVPSAIFDAFAASSGGAIPNAVAGAAGGMFIAGTNAPVTITGSGTALTLTSSGSNGAGLAIAGNGSGAGMSTTGGATGIGLSVIGGGTSGDGFKVTTTSGHGINLAPVGSSKHGLFATGGNGGTSHGIEAVAGTGGFAIDGLVDAGRILGTAISTPATAGILDVNLKNIANNTVSTSLAQIGTNVVNFGGSAGTFASGRPEVKVASIANDAVTSASIDASFTTEIMAGNPSVQDVVDGISQHQVLDAVAADGARPTIQQALYAILQILTEASVTGTTMTVKKPDGTTTLFNCTINSATTPTLITRS